MKANTGIRRVMVTGMGVVSPNGLGRAEFWEATRNGISGIAAITLFNAEKLSCRVAGEVKNFSPEDYLAPIDIKRVGRVVPFAVAAAQEALEDAHIAIDEMSLQDKRELGVILGSGGGASDFTEEQYRLFFNDQLRKVSAYNVSSSTMGAISSEVSLYFGLRGPSHVLSTGCTSSSDAIGYAYNMIRFGLAEQLVTGGADATITHGILQGFCVMRAVSGSYNKQPWRASRPFDNARDGFVLGEGAWILVLEERERAVERGATLYGEILGYGSTCDAHHRVRLDPCGEEPARAMELAIRDAGVAKDEIGYMSLHGTSTLLNDKIETLAAKLCFGRRANDIPMSSIKSMIGHPQGASGAAGIVAALLGMRHGYLPPTINYEGSDPECDLNYIPNQGIYRSVEIALCNCIGFGSKNSALVIGRGEPVAKAPMQACSQAVV
jgi:3-oxoacyl-[acyl-carrier-protein] synthase II